jgi:LmbE family N-acetylglucosaminyl deacetylase
MIVTAHPDDESMASGLISVLVAQGAEVKIVVLTNGDKGTANISITPQDLATIRVRV